VNQVLQDGFRTQDLALEGFIGTEEITLEVSKDYSWKVLFSTSNNIEYKNVFLYRDRILFIN